MSWFLGLFGSLLGWFESWTNSYILALIFYALIFKLAFSFFSVKQQKNKIKNAKLAPKIALIHAKYRGRNDTASMQKMRQEEMDLRQREGVGLGAGCLPLILQLLIIAPLYGVIYSPLSHIVKFSSSSIAAIDKFFYPVPGEGHKINEIDLINKMKAYHAENGAYDLMQLVRDEEGTVIYSNGEEFMGLLPNFNLFGINFGEIPSITNPTWLLLVPVFVGLAQWFSFWITTKFNKDPLTEIQGGADAQTAQSMKIMQFVMPAMLVFMSFNFPAMIGLYWVFQSLIGVLENFIISRIMPMPKYTKKELKELRREKREQEKAQKEALREQQKHKSLHYIDEEDYEELPDAPTNPENKPAKSKKTDSEAPEIKD